MTLYSQVGHISCAFDLYDAQIKNSATLYILFVVSQVAPFKGTSFVVYLSHGLMEVAYIQVQKV